MIQSLVTKSLKLTVSLCSRERGGGHKLWILIFHRVLECPDPLRPGEIDRIDFDRQMVILEKYFNVLSLKDAVDCLKNGNLPPRAAAITFDDGYADNLSIATPILEKYNLPATVFVSTGFIDGGRMWNDTVIESVRNWPTPKMDLSHLGLGIVDCRTDQEKCSTINIILNEIKHRDVRERQEIVDTIALKVDGLPKDMMLSTDGVRELHSRGIEIGAHTVTHPILTSLDASQAKSEIENSKKTLENIVGEEVSFFAYPNGRFLSDYSEEHAKMILSAGFIAAFTTHWGVATACSDNMQLPRFTPWDKNMFFFGLRALKNYVKGTTK